MSFLSSFFFTETFYCVWLAKLIPSHNVQVVAVYGGFHTKATTQLFFLLNNYDIFFPPFFPKLFKENKCTLLKRFSKVYISSPLHCFTTKYPRSKLAGVLWQIELLKVSRYFILSGIKVDRERSYTLKIKKTIRYWNCPIFGSIPKNCQNATTGTLLIVFVKM